MSDTSSRALASDVPTDVSLCPALGVSGDRAVVAVWVAASGTRSTHTRDAYRREATCFLTWLEENRLSLSTVSASDVHRYFQHLAAPPVTWLFTGSKAERKPTQLLKGPRSLASIAYTRTVLSRLYRYMQDASYVQHNPVALSAKPPVIVQTKITRLLDLPAWQWFWQWLVDCCKYAPNKDQLTDSVRARWVMAFAYHTGLRRFEIAKAQMSDFFRSNGQWSLRVVGKGNVERFVTVNSALLRELVGYRQHLGMPSYPVPGEDYPAVASVHRSHRIRGIDSRSLGRIFREVSLRASAHCADEHIRDQLQRMTVHWLRHTNATHRLQAGASLETTQDELGHASPVTTRIYAQVSDKARRQDAERLVTLGDHGSC